MMESPHLTNAPIKEALIDIQATLPDSFDISTVKDAFLAKVSPLGYSKVQDIRQIEIHGGRENQQVFSGSRETLIGYRFENSEGTKVIQVRTNGFTFSHLQPYARWDGFQSETTQFWNVFSELFKPTDIRRVATRFINLIKLANPYTEVAELKKSFNEAPTLPEIIKGKMQHCISRFVITQEDTGITSVITRAFEKATQEDSHIVLDIDVFKEFQSGVDESKILEILPKLRELKNQIFFECLTKETIGRFQ